VKISDDFVFLNGIAQAALRVSRSGICSCGVIPFKKREPPQFALGGSLLMQFRISK